MFDISMFAAKWAKLVAVEGPDAQEELFKAKLSRIGVKAPLGTPPAEEQLAKAVAKAQVANGGSGNFMGEPLVNGINDKVIQAQFMVDHNLDLKAAKAATDQFYKEI